VTPTSAEDLWQRLATVLPALLRIHVQNRIADRDVAGTPLADLVGPIDDGDRRRYECSERRTRAQITLVTEVNASGTSRSIAAAIIHASAAGSVVFQCNTYEEPTEKLFLKCNGDLIGEIVALIQSIEVS
jgi:hypothetical protein